MKGITGRRRGIALLLTLMVVGILTAATVSFMRSARLEAVVAENGYNFTQAEIYARAGVAGAMTLLAMDDNKYDALTEPWAQFAAAAIAAANVFEEGGFTGAIEDLSGKFNPNFMVDSRGLMNMERVKQAERLLQLEELSPDLLPPLLDWLDKDGEVRPGGTEDAYYQALEDPYPCENGPLASIGQLALVKGFTPEIVAGTEKRPGLREVMTTWSDGRININTASLKVLMSLDDDLTQTVAEEIIQRRKSEPFTKLDELREVSALTPEVFARITARVSVISTHFLVTAEGRFREARAVAVAVVERSQGSTRVRYFKTW